MAPAAVAAATPPQDLFIKNWATYQLVLAQDYLEHAALFAALRAWLADRPGAAGPLRLLDLGCGDALPVCRLLRALARPDALAEYHGVDLSEQALAVARENIAAATGNTCETTLTTSDLLAFVEAESGSPDIMLVSFSLHHLPKEAKGTFLQHAYRMLRERHGSLCLIDIVRRPDETLDQFHKRQSEDIQTWEKLGPDGRQALTNHVCTCDLPESLPVYREMAEAAGFQSVTCHFQAPRDLANFLVFQA